MAIKERPETKNSLWRVKPVDLILRQSEDSEHGLKRTLGPFSITLLGIGAIVGTGIFVLTGVAAAKYAGPGLIFSFVVAGIVSGLAAICYAEFASTVPIAGSAYTYSYALYTRLNFADRKPTADHDRPLLCVAGNRANHLLRV